MELLTFSFFMSKQSIFSLSDHFCDIFVIRDFYDKFRQQYTYASLDEILKKRDVKVPKYTSIVSIDRLMNEEALQPKKAF